MPLIETAPALLILSALGAYLLGSIPFGLLVARLFGLGDLRAIGSGNIGATNVLRTGNKLAAFLTVILDAGKAGVAVLIARALWAEDAAQLAGLCAFLGHLFPIWLGFRGGKGVATFLGTLAALAFPVCGVTCAIWLITAVVMRYSSLAALVASALSPIAALLLGYGSVSILCCALAVLIFERHRPNMVRLWNGQETKIGAK